MFYQLVPHYTYIMDFVTKSIEAWSYAFLLNHQFIMFLHQYYCIPCNPIKGFNLVAFLLEPIVPIRLMQTPTMCSAIPTNYGFMEL